MRILARCLVLLAGVGVPGVRHEALACTCAPTTLEAAVAAAETIAVVDIVRTDFDPDGTRTTFVAVRDALKGTGPGAYYDVRWREPDGKACDLVQITSGRWLLFTARGPDGREWIGPCDQRSQPVDGAAGRRAYDAARTALAPPPPPPPPPPAPVVSRPPPRPARATLPPRSHRPPAFDEEAMNPFANGSHPPARRPDAAPTPPSEPSRRRKQQARDLMDPFPHPN